MKINKKRRYNTFFLNLQKDDTTEKGIYHTLKEVMEERDDDGKQWFTQENASTLLMNFVAAGW